MVKLAALGIIGIFLAGCAGGREQTCEVFSPAQIDLPSTRIEGQSSGDPTGTVPEQRC
jgi:hypothetical protein